MARYYKKTERPIFVDDKMYQYPSKLMGEVIANENELNDTFINSAALSENVLDSIQYLDTESDKEIVKNIQGTYKPFIEEAVSKVFKDPTNTTRNYQNMNFLKQKLFAEKTGGDIFSVERRAKGLKKWEEINKEKVQLDPELYNDLRRFYINETDKATRRDKRAEFQGLSVVRKPTIGDFQPILKDIKHNIKADLDGGYIVSVSSVEEDRVARLMGNLFNAVPIAAQYGEQISKVGRPGYYEKDPNTGEFILDQDGNKIFVPMFIKSRKGNKVEFKPNPDHIYHDDIMAGLRTYAFRREQIAPNPYGLIGAKKGGKTKKISTMPRNSILRFEGETLARDYEQYLDNVRGKPKSSFINDQEISKKQDMERNAIAEVLERNKSLDEKNIEIIIERGPSKGKRVQYDLDDLWRHIKKEKFIVPLNDKKAMARYILKKNIKDYKLTTLEEFNANRLYNIIRLGSAEDSFSQTLTQTRAKFGEGGLEKYVNDYIARNKFILDNMPNAVVNKGKRSSILLGRLTDENKEKIAKAGLNNIYGKSPIIEVDSDTGIPIEYEPITMESLEDGTANIEYDPNNLGISTENVNSILGNVFTNDGKSFFSDEKSNRDQLINFEKMADRAQDEIEETYDAGGEQAIITQGINLVNHNLEPLFTQLTVKRSSINIYDDDDNLIDKDEDKKEVLRKLRAYWLNPRNTKYKREADEQNKINFTVFPASGNKNISFLISGKDGNLYRLESTVESHNKRLSYFALTNIRPDFMNTNVANRLKSSLLSEIQRDWGNVINNPGDGMTLKQFEGFDFRIKSNGDNSVQLIGHGPFYSFEELTSFILDKIARKTESDLEESIRIQNNQENNNDGE